MNNYSKMLANYSRIPLDVSRRTALQDAHQSESKSIEYLKQLVAHSAEVFNLWKLLSEHQFFTIANKLSDVCSNQNFTCQNFISSSFYVIINFYLCITIVYTINLFNNTIIYYDDNNI